MTVAASIRLPPTSTPLPSTAVTAAPSRTSTPSFIEREARLLGQGRVKRRQQAIGGLDENDVGFTRVDHPEIRSQRLSGEFGDGSGHLHARRSAADDDEVEEAPSLGRVRLGLGLFEGDEDALPQIGRVVDALQTRSEGCPILAAEIGVAGTGREDQHVVGNGAILRDDVAARRCRRR